MSLRDYMVEVVNPETNEQFGVIIKQVEGHDAAIKQTEKSYPHCTAVKSSLLRIVH
jgi:hypothetical protein